MTKQIIVVDDQVLMLKLLGYMLERSGFSVLKAKDTYTVLDMLESSIPDMVITDVMMAEMDGIELCRRMRARPETPQTPIVILGSCPSF